MNPGGGEGMEQVTVSMQKYTDVLEKDMKFKLEERKKKKKEKDEEGFNDLPQVKSGSFCYLQLRLVSHKTSWM